MRDKRDFSLKRREYDDEEFDENFKFYEGAKDPEKCHWAKELCFDIYISTLNCIPCLRVNPKDCNYVAPDSKIERITKNPLDGKVIIDLKDNEGE